MKVAVFALVALVAAASGGPCPETPTTVSGTQAPRDYCSGDLIFSDEFDYFDHKKWQHENTMGGGGNGEFQWYGNTRSNSYVVNGILNIRPTFTADSLGYDALYRDTLDINGGAPADKCTNPAWSGCIRTGSDWNILNPIRSARMRTADSFSFKYGRLEVRAKMPKGDWIWPAIWMMPRYNAYGGWPTSGEIDILEGRGNVDYYSGDQNIGTQLAGSTLHWGLDWTNNQAGRTHWERSNPAGYDTDFHTYGFVWTPWDMAFYLDGQELGRVTPPAGGFWDLGELWWTGQPNPWANQGVMAPFDQEFYLIMNVAVGGTNSYFPDGAWNSNGEKPWQNWSPQAMKEFWEGRSQWEPTWQENRQMEVDWVRIYAL